MEKIKSLFFAQHLGQKIVFHPSDNCPFELLGVYEDKAVIRGDFSGGTHPVIQTGHEPIKDCILALRGVSQLTDDEAIQVARFAHQMPKTNFKATRNSDLIHVQYTDDVGITYHISLYKDYGTVNANMHFERTKKEPFSSCKTNIGEISVSSQRPVPYIAICDYLRSIGVVLPFTYMDEAGVAKTLSVPKMVDLGWLKNINLV